MTLKRIKKAIKEYNVSWLLKYFFVVNFWNNGEVKLHGDILKIKFKLDIEFEKIESEYFVGWQYIDKNLTITLS